MEIQGQAISSDLRRSMKSRVVLPKSRSRVQTEVFMELERNPEFPNTLSQQLLWDATRQQSVAANPCVNASSHPSSWQYKDGLDYYASSSLAILPQDNSSLVNTRCNHCSDWLICCWGVKGSIVMLLCQMWFPSGPEHTHPHSVSRDLPPILRKSLSPPVVAQ